MKRKLTFNALLLLGSDGGSRLLTFIANVHLARVLGTREYGVVFLALTVLTVALQAGDLGLATLGTRESAKPVTERDFTPGDVASLRMLLGLVAALATAVVVSVAVEDPVARRIAWIFLAGVVPSFWQLEWYFQGSRRYVSVAVVRYTFAVAYLAGIWFVIGTPEDVTDVPIIYIGALLLAASVAIFLARNGDRLGPGLSWFDPEQWKRWFAALRRSAPIGFGGGVAQVIQLLPPIAIASFYSDSEVGEFGAAFRLAINLMIVDRAFIALFLPAVSNLLARGSERSPAVLAKTFRGLIVGGVGLGLVVTLLSGWIIELIYGSSYANAALPLAIMSWFVGATLINSFFSSILVAAGIEKSYLHSSLVSSVLGVLLILILTWQLGIVGAATGVSVSEAIMATLMYRNFRKHVGIPLRHSDANRTAGSGDGNR